MKPLKLLFVLSSLAMLACSCVTSREVSYLHDLNPNQTIPLNSKFEAIISPYDQLRINVIGVGVEKELAEPFNPYGNTQNTTANTMAGYLVDVNGNIQFPILGMLHVAGMTRLQLQDAIKNRLIEEGHMNDPMVNVRFMNFRVYVLGTADGGKVLNIANERCTFLEALAMAGGLNKYTKRDKIAVMREVDGKMVMRYLDPRSSSVFQDPFFMLQQNDFIITQNYTKDTPRREARNIVSWMSVVLSSLTFVFTMIGYMKPNN